MDLETKIGQLFIYIGPTSRQVGHYDRRFLRGYRPGGLIYKPNTLHHHCWEVAAYLRDLQTYNLELGLPGPLIVCVDHRGGDSSILTPEMNGLEFPAPLAQAALADEAEQAGEEIGAAIARDVLDVGFNLNLSPYADFLERGDIQRFVFGNSMMGADPHVNARLSIGLIRGMHAEGLGTTYCVFPGGYGSLDRDPHHFVGVVGADRQELDERYFVAPRAAFAAGADAVMLSHFQFPALDSDPRPATFSAPIIQGVLRDELGFDGLVMTDSIRMHGGVDVAGSRGEAAVRALEAGADMILCASWEERMAVAEAVRSGRITSQRLDEALERVLALKSRLASRVPGIQEEADPEDQARMAHWIGRSLSWVRRLPDWQPLNVDSAKKLVAVASWPAFLDAAGAVLGQSVRVLHLPLSNPTPWDGVNLDEELALLLAMTGESERILFGTSTVEDLILAQKLYRAGRDVWVTHAGRVFEAEQAPELPTLLLMYSHGPIAGRKAMEVFAGLTQAQGEVPVPLKTQLASSH